jgi:hypothetical protein
MTPEPNASATRLEMLAMFALCGLLFIAAASEPDELLWSIPAMTLFAITGTTFLCVLNFNPPDAASTPPRPQQTDRAFSLAVL